jgi:hypothetical protein
MFFGLPSQGDRMGAKGRKERLPKKAEDGPTQPPPDTEEDYEDGDIATPKRDRYGTDDEPL